MRIQSKIFCLKNAEGIGSVFIDYPACVSRRCSSKDEENINGRK